MNKFTKVSLIAAAIAISSHASAEVRINGFANLIGGTTGSDESFLGYDDNFGFDSQSLFALQLSGDINDKMSATAQIVARGDDDYSARFEWAYMAYQFNESTTFTAGRFRLPLFSFSTSKDIGYSYHWVTAPSTVYDVAFNNIDGFKIDYSTYSGDWEYNFTGAFGTFESLGDNGINTVGNNTIVVSGEAVYESWKFRAVYAAATVTMDFLAATNTSTQAIGEAFNIIKQLGLPDLADNLAIDEDDGGFVGLSIQYDNFDWFFGAEATKINIDDAFTNADNAFYVTAGKRLGKWTPSVTFENISRNGDVKYQNQIAQLAGLPLPAEVIAPLQGLAVGVQLAQKTDFDVLSLTLRYDLDASIALKADVSKLSDSVDDAYDATTLRLAVNYVF